MIFQPPSLFACLYLLSATGTSFTSATATDLSQYHASALIQWLEGESNGFFHPALELRRSNPSDPSSAFGMFAKYKISEDDLLLRIPRTIILGSTDLDAEPDDCSIIRNLARNLKLGSESQYAPYMNYLLDTQSPDQLPSAWSEAGKSLLVQFLGVDGNIQLPPDDPIGLISNLPSECKKEGLPTFPSDSIEEFAALIVSQRSWDDLLIPVYDIMNHQNGWRMNTKTENSVHDADKDVSVLARRDIQKGEELYVSYNMCEDCGGRRNSYGTPDILRDYGFLEQLPQRWFFPGVYIAFVVDEVKDPETKERNVKVTEWINGLKPQDEDMDPLNDLLQDIRKRKELLLKARDVNVPDHEWHTIVAYANSFEFAIYAAIKEVRGKDLECVWEDSHDSHGLDPANWESFTLNELEKVFGCHYRKPHPVITKGNWQHFRDLYNQFESAQGPNDLDTSYKLGNEPSTFPIEVVMTRKKGRGLIASRNIAKGEKIFRASNNTIVFRTGHAWRKLLWHLYNASPPPDKDGYTDGFACDILSWSWNQRWPSPDGPIQILVAIDESSLLNSVSEGEVANIQCGVEKESQCGIDYYSIVDIKRGEEILCEYSDFSTPQWHTWGL